MTGNDEYNPPAPAPVPDNGNVAPRASEPEFAPPPTVHAAPPSVAPPGSLPAPFVGAPQGAPYGVPYGPPQGAPYGQPYGAPYGQPYGYGAPAPAAGSSQKNYLGILALIFPFVSLSAVGIVMGHMALAAVKKGTANNHGVALAGTVVSWVMTGLVVPGVLAAIAIPIYLDQKEKAHEVAAENDLRTLGIAVSEHILDDPTPPAVSIEGTHYLVGDQTEPKSAFVNGVHFVMTGAETYCIEVTYDGNLVRSINNVGTVSPGGCPQADAWPGAESPAPTDDGASDLVAFSVLVKGDCIADPNENIVTADDGSTWLSGVTLIDCAEPHWGQVFSVEQMPGDTYVEADVMAAADAQCRTAYEVFMGVSYDDSSYYYTPFYPSPDGWEMGDTETTCVVFSEESDTVGSLEGSGL